jgi:voltage-dependent calcium channel P/Q type alpha-1A
MDFIVVSTGILEMYGEFIFALLGLDSSILTKMKLLKMGRVFRPLKMISNSPDLQMVMGAILKALSPIMNIFVLLIFFILIFSIIGIEFYAGKFHSTCLDNRGNEYGGSLCKINFTIINATWSEGAPFRFG